MSEKEKAIVEKIAKAIPNMSEFDKGYFLGKVESLADGDKKETDSKEMAEQDQTQNQETAERR
nr:MAG TPA: hypothetical protein [Bacteriophage sp.]